MTERTVFRDLQTLEYTGVPWYYDTNAECYRVRSDYRFSVPSLTEEEIIGQAIQDIPGMKNIEFAFEMMTPEVCEKYAVLKNAVDQFRKVGVDSELVWIV